MSKEINEIRQIFAQRLAEAQSTTAYGTVAGVDEQARTCDVQVGGITYEGVLLYTLEKPDLKGFVFIPKQGSHVLISCIGATNRMFVEMFSEVDKVMLTIGEKLEWTIDAKGMVFEVGNTTLKATEKGMVLKGGGASLKKTLSALCDAIAQLTVSTSVGPSSVPINIAAFEQIKQGLNGYLEE